MIDIDAALARIAAGLGLAGAGMPAAPAQAALPFGMAGAPAPSLLLQ